MLTTAGYVLASIHALVVVYVVYLILFGPEPDWPMYWMLPALTSIPFGHLALLICRAFCKPQPSARTPTSEAELLAILAASEVGSQPSIQPPSIEAHDERAQPRSGMWSKATDFNNFVLPLAVLGAGGTLWWLVLPKAIQAAYRALT